jgi:hypothetical protein
MPLLFSLGAPLNHCCAGNETSGIEEIRKDLVFGPIGETFSQYSPWVMRLPGGRHVMFYCKNTAVDGLYRDRVWQAENPGDDLASGWGNDRMVIDGSAVNAEDDLCCSPGVVRLGRLWHLYYVVAARDSHMTLYLHHATAEMLAGKWTRYGRVEGIRMPIGYIETPSPLVIDGEIVLYYVGDGGVLYKTTSPDGHVFTEPREIPSPQRASHGRVTFASDRYFYVYSVHPERRHDPPTEIYLSVSGDGEWFPEGERIAVAQGEDWDGDRMWSPHLVYEGNEVLVFYAGNRGDYGWWGSNSAIGVRRYAWVSGAEVGDVTTNEIHDLSSGVFTVDAEETAGPPVLPEFVIRFDTDSAGEWVVAGDLDGDGKAELVAARNDRQAVTAASAYRLDGSPLWTWGEPGAGQPGWGYDVPLQLYDIDGDGRDEVFLSSRSEMVVLDGVTGRERRRMPLPEGLEVADCITFADLRGLGRPQDIIVKNRYTQLWAFTDDWELLWTWCSPDDSKTCHHPTPFDIDGDGRDEVLAGYTMLDHDGQAMWTFRTDTVDLSQGHLDCARVVRSAEGPEDTRLLITGCGAHLVAMIDGLGKPIWEVTGRHFESADAGTLRDDLPGPQVIVDIDHEEYGKSEVWLLDGEGRHVGTFVTGYGRHHRLIDWNSDGLDEVLITNARRIFDGHGRCVAHLGPEEELRPFAAERSFEKGDPGPFGFVGDMDGDGSPEVVLHTATAAFIYRPPGHSRRGATPARAESEQL